MTKKTFKILLSLTLVLIAGLSATICILVYRYNNDRVPINMAPLAVPVDEEPAAVVPEIQGIVPTSNGTGTADNPVKLPSTVDESLKQREEIQNNPPEAITDEDTPETIKAKADAANKAAMENSKANQIAKEQAEKNNNKNNGGTSNNGSGKPQNGDSRVNSNGQKETYDEVFGWIPDNGYGTVEEAHFQLSGNVVGH